MEQPEIVPERYKENHVTEITGWYGFRMVIPSELTTEEIETIQGVMHVIAAILVGPREYLKLFCQANQLAIDALEAHLENTV